MLDRLEFVVGEAIQGMRRHLLMSFAAITTVAVALYLIGGMGYLYLSLQKYAQELSGKYEIQAYFQQDAKMEKIHEAAEAARAIPGVGRVVHIPKEQAWKKTRRENPELTEGLENPYPDALKINVAKLERTPGIVGAIQSLPGIQSDAVMYHDPTQRFLNDLMKLVQWLGLILGGLLFATAGVLIYNAIRLTIDTRKREIRIMQLVGASHLTVRMPFLIEGATQGILGGVVATFLLWATYSTISNYVQANLSSMHKMQPFGLLPVGFSLVVLGVCYGLICSILAIRNPARLRGGAI